MRKTVSLADRYAAFELMKKLYGDKTSKFDPGSIISNTPSKDAIREKRSYVAHGLGFNAASDTRLDPSRRK